MASDFSAPIDPDRIVSETFATVRRGLDPLEVQRFLLTLSNELRDARSREANLKLKIEELERRAEPADPLDPSHLTKLLGQETVRVLDAAQSAAAEIRAKAEEGVARLLRESRDEAQQMRDEAESLLKVRSAEANDAADVIRAESAEMLERAQDERAAILEDARNEGRQMVAEAQELRERMLDDLARRRKLLRQQIEQLQAGRDRLAAAYDVVRDTLEVATEELHVALPEAKLAAEAAALKATESSDSEELLTSLETGLESSTAPIDEFADQTATPLTIVPTPASSGPDTSPVEPHEAGAPTLTIVSSPVPRNAMSAASNAEPVPEPDVPAESASEQAAPETAAADTTDGDGAVLTDSTDAVDRVEGAPAEESSVAGEPVGPEGRRSSSVRVVRKNKKSESTEGDDLFDRLRSEAPEETETEPEPEPIVADLANVDTELLGAETELVEIETVETFDVEAVVLPADLTIAEPAQSESPEADAADIEATDDGDTDVSEIFDERVADSAATEIPADAGDRAGELVAGRDAAILELEKSLDRRIKRELSDEQNELLSALTSMKGTVTAISILPSQEAQEARYSALAAPVLAEAASAGSALVGAIGGRAGSHTTVADLASLLASEIVAPLRDRLERCFSEADGDRDEVAQRIRSCFREWKAQRVEPVVSHSMVAACNRGAFDRLPKKTMVRWVVSDGATASPDCDDNALAGDIAKGDKFPTGHTNAPIHDNCRCFVAPVELVS